MAAENAADDVLRSVVSPPVLEQGTFRVYKRRWFVLIVAALLNISNAVLWISFAPVANFAAEFFQKSEEDIMWFSLIYFVSSIPLGFLSMWALDVKGLKFGLWIGAWLNALGSALRVIGAFFFRPPYCFAVSLVGQAVASFAQPFVYFIPTKVAEWWFPENQRVLATAVVGIANPLGIMIGSAVTPLFVQETSDIKGMNIAYCLPAAVCALLVTFGIHNSKPPSPPSSSATTFTTRPFLDGLKELLSNKAYWLLILVLSCGIAIFSVLVTVMEELLGAKGYSNVYAGICSCLLFGTGLASGLVASVIADKTRAFILMTKVLLALTAIFLCLFVMVTSYTFPSSKEMTYVIAASCALLGLFGFAAYPLGLELGVECSFPTVSEATSTGFILIGSQLAGLVFMGLTTLKKDVILNSERHFLSVAKFNTPIHHSSDMSVPLLTIAAIVVVCIIVFIIFFDTEYKRMKAEHVAKMARILGLDKSLDLEGSQSFENYSQQAVYS